MLLITSKGMRFEHTTLQFGCKPDYLCATNLLQIDVENKLTRGTFCYCVTPKTTIIFLLIYLVTQKQANEVFSSEQAVASINPLKLSACVHALAKPFISDRWFIVHRS